MKRAMMLGLILLPLIFSCGRPILVYDATHRRNGAMIYSSVPTRRGEVYFRGTRDVALEAEIRIDGRKLQDAEGNYHASIRSGETVYLINLPTHGWHTLSAEIWLVESGERTDYITRIEGRFYVNPLRRDRRVSTGHWWRVEFGPYGGYRYY